MVKRREVGGRIRKKSSTFTKLDQSVVWMKWVLFSFFTAARVRLGFVELGLQHIPFLGSAR